MNELQGLRILLVEDWLVVAQEIEALLLEMGCEVVGPIARLERGIEAARTEEIDAAVLDININDDEVYPVADELLLRSIPFLLMTGYDARSLPEEFRRWPRIEKPFSAEEFRAKLAELIRNPPMARPESGGTAPGVGRDRL